MSDFMKRLQSIVAQRYETEQAETKKYLTALVAHSNTAMEDAADRGNKHAVILVSSVDRPVPKKLHVALARLLIEHYGNQGFTCLPLSNETSIQVRW